MAYSAYIYGTSKRWQFVCRTTPGIACSLKRLVMEEKIKEQLIPAIIGRDISNELRNVFSLPARLGGLGFLDPSEEADFEYSNSTSVNNQLIDAIINQSQVGDIDMKQQQNIKIEIKRKRNDRVTERRRIVNFTKDDKFNKLLNLASEKGASSWLTSLPLKDYGFRLNKHEFDDAIAMRYDFRVKDVSKNCVCGEGYTINHCLTCKKGGYIHIRHNVVRDTTHEFLTEVCKDVKLEPLLQPITSEELPSGSNVADGARSDVSALGFWAPLRRAFFDIRVFNPQASTNWCKDIPEMYAHHEHLKKREYNARMLEVEKGSFTPLVFSCSGGFSKEADKFIKHLAEKLSHKRNERYSVVVNFIRTRIRFEILKTCVISLRGERSSRKESRLVAEIDIDKQINMR